MRLRLKPYCGAHPRCLLSLIHSYKANSRGIIDADAERCLHEAERCEARARMVGNETFAAS